MHPCAILSDLAMKRKSRFPSKKVWQGIFPSRQINACLLTISLAFLEHPHLGTLMVDVVKGSLAGCRQPLRPLMLPAPWQPLCRRLFVSAHKKWRTTPKQAAMERWREKLPFNHFDLAVLAFFVEHGLKAAPGEPLPYLAG